MAIGAGASLRCGVERSSTPAARCEARKANRSSASPFGMTLFGARDLVAGRALDRACAFRGCVCCVGAGLRPGILTVAMAGTAFAASVAEIELSVDVEGR